MDSRGVSSRGGPLAVEISDTTVLEDRGLKASLYAEAGIADYWVVLLQTRSLVVCRNPGVMPDGSFGYRSVSVYGEQDTVSPLAAPHAIIRVADLLPPVPSGDKRASKKNKSSRKR